MQPGRTLQVLGSTAPIDVMAGERLLLRILVVGDDADRASLSSPDLPPFATLSDSTLTLAPTRSHTPGDYTVTIVATTPTQRASSTFQIRVKRFNQPPGYFTIFVYDGIEEMKCACQGAPLLDAERCRFDNDPQVMFPFTEPDGDPVFVEVELQPSDAGLGVVNRTFRFDPPSYSTSSLDGVRALDGLLPGTQYRFVLRVCDALGACATQPSSTYFSPIPLDGGWFDFGTISRGPAGASCMHATAGEFCSTASDCCSGSCDFTVVGYCGLPFCNRCGTCR
jgi:hypothetical protein